MTYNEWLTLNPLKQWMDELPEHRRQVMVASYLGVTPFMIYLYLRGNNTPTKHFPKLIALTDDEKLPSRWDKWIQLREEGTVDFGTSDSTVA